MLENLLLNIKVSGQGGCVCVCLCVWEREKIENANMKKVKNTYI